MTRLVWGEGSPMNDRGVSQGVLYSEGSVVPWNGLVSVDEKMVGSISVEHYFDGNRLYISQETGDFEATIAAYTYPDAFQSLFDSEIKGRFGLCYRVESGDAHILHIAYNLLVVDDAKNRTTLSDRENPMQFRWDIYGEPVHIPGADPASHLILSAPRAEVVLEILEDILYGTETTQPRLPSPEEVIEIYESHTTMRVTYLGDGVYTVTGPDDMVSVNEDGSFVISSPSAHFADPGKDTFVVSSY